MVYNFCLHDAEACSLLVLVRPSIWVFVTPRRLLPLKDTLQILRMADVEDYRKDMEAFFKMAKYPLVRQTDMLAEMREEAVDVCVTAVEKHQADMEKCTQVEDTLHHCSFQITCWLSGCWCQTALHELSRVLYEQHPLSDHQST